MITAVSLIVLAALSFILAAVLTGAAVVFAIKRQFKRGAVYLVLAVLVTVIGLVSGGVFTYKSTRRVGRAIIVAITPSPKTDYDTETSTEIFQVEVMDTIPASIVWLHDYKDNLFPLDPSFWLHFRIAPDDFKEVLRQFPYEKMEGNDNLGYRAPSWWKTETLGVSPEGYIYREQDHPPHSDRILWVNPEHTEVYFVRSYN